MTVVLDLENQSWPLFRILTRPSWNGGSTPALCGAGGWTIQPMARRGTQGPGFTVKGMSRRALPEIGEATFSVNYGRIDGQILFADPASASHATGGSSWDPGADQVAVPDLKDSIVAIQVADAPEDDQATLDSLTWTTAFVGYVAFQEDNGWPGAAIPSGTREYYCLDLLHRSSKWTLNRHGFAGVDEAGGSYLIPANNAGGLAIVGHPGYNVGDGTNLAKNRHATQFTVNGTYVFYHTWPGCISGTSAGGGYWTDQQAVNHALAVVRPGDEPLFVLAAAGTGALDALGCTTAWEIDDTSSVLDFLVRVLRRQRARGVAYLDWTTTGSGTSTRITVGITVAPQFYNDLTVDYGATTIRGANTADTDIAVDLIGDHRLEASVFSIGDRNQNRYDRVVTEGEQIEVAVSLSTRDGNAGSTEATRLTNDGTALARRWSGTEQTAFNAATLTARGATKYDHIYTTYGLPRGWTGVAGDGNGTTPYRVDYRTDDDGNVVVPTGSPDTAPNGVEILSDLPFLEGWDYSVYPAARSSGSELGEPKRQQAVIYLRISSEHFVLSKDPDAHEAHHTQHYKDGFKVCHGVEGGARPIGNTTILAPSRYNHQDMVVSVGIRLPHRVHFATGPEAAKRVLYLRHRDHHLWLAAANCIYALTRTAGTNTTGYAPLRAALGGSATNPGWIRDDRTALSNLHRLAVAWYMTDHLPCEWALNACGFLPSFETTTATVVYPTMGKLVHTLAANGHTQTVNCPITGIAYDNMSGKTTWTTDWGTLDYQ